MKRMTRSCGLLLVLALVLGGIPPASAATAAPGRQWGTLMDIAYQFSWYPRQDLQKLLQEKAGEYGENLESYRGRLLTDLTGGRPVTESLQPADLVAGKPWRDYLRLSLAEFCLYLASDKPEHLQNARAALALLERKRGQPEVAFWGDLFRAEQACLEKNREAFIRTTFDLWQNVILRFETESVAFPGHGAKAGFVANLPYLYENLADLILRKAILDRKIPDLYPLSAVILDIRPKMTVKNGYRHLVDQVAERMRGPSSDRQNLNFAMALIEATSRRYDVEDAKEGPRLAAKFNLALNYYRLADRWADTPQGKTAILTRYMGFSDYLLRRFGSRPALWQPGGPFSGLPEDANGQLERAIRLFNRLAPAKAEKPGRKVVGFENEKTYLLSLHQLWDSTAKLSIVLSGFYKAERRPGHEAEIFAAARPLEAYCNLFARYAPANPRVLPDNAYFMTAFAAKELGALYRDRARFSLDSRDDARALAYQMEAADLFPLDIPGILQMAFQASRNGQVRQYFHYSKSLAARLRAFTRSADWNGRNSTKFEGMIALLPTVIPKVIENPYALLDRLPSNAISEDELFTRAVAMVRDQTAASPENRIHLAAAESPNDPVGTRVAPRAKPPAVSSREYPFFKLKSRLYGASEDPLHHFLRVLFNDVPFQKHPYVRLLATLR
jgi:hypothetical protein